MLSSAQSAKIKTTLEAFVCNPEPFILNFDEPINIRTLAGELTFLPMVFDMSGCYGIRPNGEIVVLDFKQEEPFKLEPENEPRICRMVLFQGSKKYPDLVKLIPNRPDDAVDCNSCNGTGIEPMNENLGFEDHTIVCWCGGLGWLNKGEKES